MPEPSEKRKREGGFGRLATSASEGTVLTVHNYEEISGGLLSSGERTKRTARLDMEKVFFKKKCQSISLPHFCVTIRLINRRIELLKES